KALFPELGECLGKPGRFNDSSDIFENKVSSHDYERQAHGTFLVQHHLSDGAYDMNPESLHNAEEDS
uniref:hypothetical protein n=1 Tax=Pseudomonas sp. TaxID=306 RepID=UPI00289A7F65